MRRKDSKACTGRLVLIRSPQSPESNGTTTELSEPTLQFRLSSVMGQTAQMQNLAAFGQKGTHIGSGIHGTGHDLGVLVWGLRLADQAPQDTGEGDGFLHSTAGGGGGQGLQVERQVVFDGGGGLNGLNFEGGTDVGQRAGAKGKRLGVMGLPSLVFGTKVEGARVLEIGRKDDGLIAGLAGQLNTKIPRIQGDKGKLQVLGEKVFLGESVEPVDSVTESTCRTDVLPCQSGQTRCGEGRQPPFEPADGGMYA